MSKAKRFGLVTVAAAVLFGCAPFGARADAETYAITNATVYTLGPAGKIEHGTVVVRDGRISAVGAAVAVPPDASRIDGTGKIVTPGLFDPISRFGIEEVSAVKETRDLSVEGSRFTASFDVTAAINPRSMLIPVNRIAGVTTAVVAPAVTEKGTILAGLGAVIHLGSTERYLLKTPAAMFAAFGERGAELSGGSRAAAMLYLREALQDARDFRANRAAYDGARRRSYVLDRPDLLALDPVLRGEIPLVVSVDRASDILAALALARDFNLKLVIAGGAEGLLAAGDLARARVPVVLNPLQDLPSAFESLGSTLENAARLAKAGVLIAFETGDSHNARNLTQLAGNAVAYGLPYEEGLKAIMLNPARIYGLDGRTGSLAPGKDADLVVWNGDPLEVTTAAEEVFIEGRKVPMVSRQTLLRDRYLGALRQGNLPPQYGKP
ncbi:MAG: amidohydrolase family protein [Thermoanaerobaculia bacterium]